METQGPSSEELSNEELGLYSEGDNVSFIDGDVKRTTGEEVWKTGVIEKIIGRTAAVKVDGEEGSVLTVALSDLNVEKE